jgi:hypothetical protein
MVSTGVDISTFRQTLSAASSHRIKHIVHISRITTLRRGELGRWIVERFDTRFDI